jgi:hypothetical protein
MPIKEDIVKRINALFEKKKWTKNQFAEIVHEYPQNVNKILSGKLDPLKIVQKLGDYGEDIVWLLTGKETIYTAEGFNQLVRDVQAEFGEVGTLDKMVQKIAELEEENKRLKEEREKLLKILNSGMSTEGNIT